MTRLGQLTMAGAMVALALMLTVSTHQGRDASSPATWGSSSAMQDPARGFWRSHSEASSAAQTYAVGWSGLVAISRISVMAESGLELTNLGASGFLLLESGVLVLADAEGIVEVQRAASGVATELAPVGIGSKLGRGDRIAFRSSATITLRNPEPRTTASIVMVTELSDLPEGGPLQ